jgi:hypothetical protein
MRIDPETQRLRNFVAKELEEVGPYLSERQWGTVREDYSVTAMPGIISRMTCSFPSLSLGGRAGDRQQTILCFALALWNGRDPILKERLFG